MINLPKLKDADVESKKVIVRMDLDVPEDDISRIEVSLPTLKFLLERNCGIVVIGHKGRPEISLSGKPDPNLSVLPFKEKIESLLGAKDKITLLENLRFDKGEEKNNPEFAKKLATFGDFYINEAFAVSHRKHASIISLPKLLPHAAGLRFTQEVENLSKVFENPKSPVVAVISGVKDDKLSYVEGLLKFCDKVLIGGRLPDYIHDASPLRKNKKVIIGTLIADKEDLSLHSMEEFEKEVAKAGTLILSGPLGKFEEEGHRQGTERVLKAIVKSQAFKVAGGGDTQKAIKMFNLKDKFDWISVGGGAMLEFLVKGTLPGIEALIS